MKKTLLLTTRVDKFEEYDEVRFGIDQNLVFFFFELGFDVLLAPNNKLMINSLAKRVKPEGIVLSAGNDIDPNLYGQTNLACRNISQDRDQTELLLIQYALDHNVPLLGICRGMQMINVAFEGELVQGLRTKTNYNNHVNTTHTIHFNKFFLLQEYQNTMIQFNSFHDHGIVDDNLGTGLVAVAHTEDGVVEAFQHQTLKILGIEWHPERKNSNSDLDKMLITRFFDLH